MAPQVKTAIYNFYYAHKQPIDSLAAYLNVPPLWLVALWHQESGLNPAIQNSIGATGLNQMLPATLQGLGYTAAQYKAMSVEQQIQVMRAFYAPIAGRIKRAGDLYLFNFYPKAVIDNWYMDRVIFTKPETGYNQNAGLDYNNDGVITRNDVVQLFETKYDEVTGGYGFFRSLLIDIKTNPVAWAIVVVAVAIAIYLILKFNV